MEGKMGKNWKELRGRGTEMRIYYMRKESNFSEGAGISRSILLILESGLIIRKLYCKVHTFLTYCFERVNNARVF